MTYEAVIGLEVHAQMLTKTKIFCGCPTKFGSEPNTQTCPVCIGMPGVLPVLNEKALEFAVRTGLATNCTVSPLSRFARKNYFYPDLPKGYQISQFDLPICERGFVEITVQGKTKRVGITRIHMEEDAGKNIHEVSGSFSYVDLNRAGVPLMEIVSEPDIRSPAEAAAYMKKLRNILRYIGVCDGNMEQGSLRCDANVSVREAGSPALGVKVEIKNINSFRFVEKALEYEIRRQMAAVEEGAEIIQETRLFDPQTGTTQPMRTKEEAHDYRYFPEPDLVPMAVDRAWVEGLRSNLPELPDSKSRRFTEGHGLAGQDADLISAERPLAEWYEEAVRLGGKPKTVFNWVMGELMRLMNEDGTSIEDCPLKPKALADLLGLVERGEISGTAAKTVFVDMYRTGRPPEDVVKERGLSQVSDEKALAGAVEAVISANPKEAERFRAGEEKLMGFFVGQVMRETKGKANPNLINEILRRMLSA